MFHRFWPVLVPLVWCGIVFAIMRPDAIRARPDVPFAVKWLFYDESDLTALALRGANTHAGRLPGRADEPDVLTGLRPDQLTVRLDAPPQPYSPRFYLEYPTAALAVFELGYLIQPNATPPPPAVADSLQYGVAFFEPRNDAERQIWTQFRVAIQCYVAVMTAGLIGLLLVLRKTGGPVWLAVLPGAVFFALNRFDVLPTLAVAGCFLALSRGRPGWAGGLLAVGVLLKVFPVLFVPIILRHLGVRNGAIFLAAFAAVNLVGIGVSWAVLDWESTVGPIRVQLSRPFVANNWSLYGFVLPVELADWKLVRLSILAAAVLAGTATRPRDLDAVRRRCALALTVFVVLAVFWSPQWILWFLPLTVPLARRTPVRIAVIALDAVNYFSFPILFWILWEVCDANGLGHLYGPAANGMIYVRAATWAGFAVVLFWDAFRKPRAGAAVSAFRANADLLREAFRSRAASDRLRQSLTCLSAEPLGEPVFVRDRETGDLIALVPLLVQFTPVAGSALEDVPQAREPRPVTAIMTFKGEAWTTDGRTIFNLTPQQVAAQGRYAPAGSFPEAPRSN